jgi:ADP-ribosylglycohydrolase
VREISSLTHRHIRSIVSCFLYLELALLLVRGEGKQAAYQRLCTETGKWLTNTGLLGERELKHFERILGGRLGEVKSNDIRSSGYVIHSLEAALWCFLRTDNYEDAVLTAVNLGEDTDTVAAIAGGLAGLAYGWNNIPPDWLAVLARREDIEELGERLSVKTGK